jgi:Effector-associated domain 7/CHAT domain/Tetratricopeptide repeat
VSELGALRDGLRNQQPPPPLRWHRIAPDRAALIDLATSEPILFHYTGHGSVDDGQPVLCFDDGAGTMRPQEARSLAADLRGRTYFAFLNACRTADSAEPGANLALALVQGGIPAVLGMQTRIADEGATLLAETFYQQLVAGRPLEEALWRARLRLAHSFGADPTMWGIPALYRAAGYRLPRQAYAGPPPASVEPPDPDTSSLQAPAHLLGRAVELAELMRLFVFERKRVITIRGPGGMGKTALVHELAARLRFHFRDGIFAVTLAPAGEQAELSAATLRAELARRLGLRHPAFDDPAAVDQQEEAIVGAVHGERALLIFDNYETVLTSLGREPADRVVQDQTSGPAGLTTLRRMLLEHFSDGELRDLCFDLGTDYESLPGEGKANKARELILACGRMGKLAALVARCTQQRPNTAVAHARGERRGAGSLPARPARPGAALQVRPAAAIQRLVTRLANDGACLLFTTRQSPVDLPDEVAYPPAAQGEQLGGLDQASAIALFRQRAGDRQRSEALPGQVARAVGYSPLAIQLAASRWARGWQTEGEFLANLNDELLQAEQAGEPFHRRSVLVNVGLSIDALAPELQRALYELALVANPAITPLHAAVVWGLEDEQSWFADQAHVQLEQLQDRSLLQGVEQRDEQRDRALAYTFQPVIAQVLRARADAQDLSAARERYAAWAAQMIELAFGEGGIAYSQDVARKTQFYLPDLVAALPYRPADRRGWDAWQLAVILKQFGRIPEAVQALALAEQMAQETGQQDLAARVETERANQAVLRGDLDGAMRRYEQSLQMYEALGDVQGKSATLHQMANVLVTRGDLDGAMRRYEQAKEILEALGDVKGKASTLIMIAQLHVMRREREAALAAARESIAIFTHLRAPRELAQAREILATIEAWTDEAEGPALATPARLAGALVAMTTAALRGDEAGAQARAALSQAAQDAQLGAYAAALANALEREPGAPQQVLAAAETLLAEASPAERATVLSGVANVADLLGDTDVELVARRQAIDAQRHAGDDRETLVQLSVMLYNLAMLHQNQGDFGTALPLLEEVVALDLRTGHPDLESDRAALEAARRRAAGQPEPTLRDAIIAWRDGDRDAESLAGLLDLVCNLVVAPIQAGDHATRDTLAQDLTLLRAVHPLPIPGAGDFLHVLQLRLRDEESMREQAARIAAGLPSMFQGALSAIERTIAGEDSAGDADDESEGSGFRVQGARRQRR